MIAVKAAQLILSLSILVIVHEFGHFLFAKLFKCRIEKFYLFFDPWFSLFKIKKGETEYGIGWLPLGGYVKIAGMIDESMDKEQLKQPAQPWEFRSKPSWQRLIIMVGGVLFNLILALIIYSSVLFVWGNEYLPTKNATYGIVVNETGREIGLRNGDKILSVDGKEVDDFYKIIPTILLENAKTIQVQRDSQEINIPVGKDVIAKIIKEHVLIAPRTPFTLTVTGFTKESPARDAGMEIGDKVLAMNGHTFRFYDQFSDSLAASKGKEVKLEVLRNGKEKDIPIKVGKNGMLGVSRSVEGLLQLKTIHYSLLGSIPAGITKSFTEVGNYLKQFKLLFAPETKAYESLGGFISIGNIFPGVWDWQAFWNLTAFLSIILAVMNILPIPALDGGHVLFLLYEIVTRRKPSDKFLEYAQITGMVILVALLLFANGNDLIKLFK